MVMPLYSSIEKLDKPLLGRRAISVPASCRPLFASLSHDDAGNYCRMSAGDAASDGPVYVSDLMGGAKNLLIGNVIKDSSSIFVTGRLVQPPALR